MLPVTWRIAGALASQLGSVTVSSAPDEQSGEVGGVQNTVINLGASSRGASFPSVSLYARITPVDEDLR